MGKFLFFFLLAAGAMCAFFFYQKSLFDDGKLHVVFCDVGQGDSIFVRTPRGSVFLVDGGPNDAVLDCLSRHMPFWQRTISVMALTHPHADHLNGLVTVARNYTIDHFITEHLLNKTLGYKNLQKALADSGVDKKDQLAGDKITFADGVSLKILGPTKAYLERTSPNGTIGESREFGSLITLVSFGDFHMLLDGDSQVEGLSDALEGHSLPSIEVFQVPHHGSKYGLSSEMLKKIHPALSVISVGKKNRYGHPAPFTLTLLQQQNIKYMRTDLDGDIEIVTDGKEWFVK